MMWLKNTSGKRDAMLSFAFAGLVVTCTVVIFSFLNAITVGSFSMTFVTLTASHVALLTVFLGATITAYVNRRNAKDKHAAKIEELKLRSKLCLPPPKEDTDE